MYILNTVQSILLLFLQQECDMYQDNAHLYDAHAIDYALQDVQLYP